MDWSVSLEWRSCVTLTGDCHFHCHRKRVGDISPCCGGWDKQDFDSAGQARRAFRRQGTGLAKAQKHGGTGFPERGESRRGAKNNTRSPRISYFFSGLNVYPQLSTLSDPPKALSKNFLPPLVITPGHPTQLCMEMCLILSFSSAGMGNSCPS